MSDTKNLATSLIFVVCALYVFALLIIAIRFLLQYLKALRAGGEFHWRQSAGESPRNSFLHELRINPVNRNPRGRIIVEPPPSYAYAIDEQPPTYEDYEKYYSKNVTPSISPSPADSATNISTISASTSASSTSKSQKQEECLPPPGSGVPALSDSVNANSNIDTHSSSSVLDTSVYL